jgi:hypothetical protein
MSEDDCLFVSCSFFMSLFFCDLDILLFLTSWVLFRKRGMNLGAQVFCIIYRREGGRSLIAANSTTTYC